MGERGKRRATFCSLADPKKNETTPVCNVKKKTVKSLSWPCGRQDTAQGGNARFPGSGDMFPYVSGVNHT